MSFDHCQCGLIQAQQKPEIEHTVRLEANYSWSWTRINQLPIGRCRCLKCNVDNTKRRRGRPNTKEDIEQTPHIVSGAFAVASFKANEERLTLNKHCFDSYEVKRNVLETAFETAESIASLGAVVSLT